MPLEISFTFPLKNGLHARPASFFRDTADRFNSKITLTNQQNKITVNAKSTLALISTLTKYDDDCTLTFDGVDEQAAVEAFRDFLSNQFLQCDMETTAPERDQRTKTLIPRMLKFNPARILLGTPVSKGIVRAKALVLNADLNLPDLSAYQQGVFAQELSKVQFAFDSVKCNMEKRLALATNEIEKAILKAQLSIVSDDEFSRRAILQLESKGCRAGEAIAATAKKFEEILEQSESVYLRERVLDIRDIAKRLISALYGDQRESSEIALTAESICVAEFLTPMQISQLDQKLLKGIVLSQGGENSHTAIFARSMNIPCVTGVANAPLRIHSGQELLLDAIRGIVIPAPSARTLRFYEYESKKETVHRQKLREHVHLPGRTADGKKLEIAANVGSFKEVVSAFQNGADGIGIFRTEMLFMNRNQPPSEEDQFSIYSETARIAGSRPVIVRTLDIGGDKRISYMPMPEEKNPYLGCRAVRLYKNHHSIIDAHLRALIRASAFGNLKVMFPMISHIDEVRMMREWIRKIMNEYAKTGIAFNTKLQIGIMIEIPSVAFIIDQLSREVDFFSIGSNDLLQYFVAADRGNENLTYLCNPFQPSFLRLIKHIIDKAHRWEKWIGLCGEMGGDPLATPLLVGCEIDEISLSYSNIPSIKHLVNQCNSSDCRNLLQAALQRENANEIEAELRAFAEQWVDRSLISEENVQLYSESTTKEEAIKEMVDMLELSGRLRNADKVEDAIWQREESYSTGVGFGIAIPHCKSSDVIINSIAILRLRNPIEWKSLDASPVRFVLMLAVDAFDLGNEHLKMIARLSRKLMDEDYRNKLIKAESVTEIITLLDNVLKSIQSGA